MYRIPYIDWISNMKRRTKKNNEESMLVKEDQYRAVITYLPNKNGYKASVQRRIGIGEWVKVQCGLKGVVFASKESAENRARYKIKEQKGMDNAEKNSYIVYDD